MSEIITTSSFKIGATYVRARTAYEYSVIEDAEVLIDSKPAYTAKCYKTIVGEDTIHIPVTECVEVSMLPIDFEYTHFIDSLEEKYTDKTTDYLTAYEEIYGIDRYSMYTPDIDGIILDEHKNEDEVEEEAEENKGLSALPFIY